MKNRCKGQTAKAVTPLRDENPTQTKDKTMLIPAPATSRDIPVYNRRHTTVTVWDAATGTPEATGSLTRKLKNGVRIHGCHRGLGVEQDLSEKTYLDGRFTFTWE